MRSKEPLERELPSNWSLFTVRDLVDQKILEKPLDGNHGGMHPKGSDFVKTGIPFIMASDIKDGRLSYDYCKCISEFQANKLRKGFAAVGDVLLTHKATIGRVALVKEIPSNYIMLTPQVTYYRVINKEVLDNVYLKYYFQSDYFNSLLQQWSDAGSTRSYIGITEQLKLPIVVPSIKEQHFIVDILSSLDDKIDLNHAINKNLESIAQALFKRWFVDFEFPNENGEPYKSSGGEFEESELGLIPKGWSIKNIHELITTIIDHRGKTPKKLGGEWASNGVLALSAKNIKRGELVQLDKCNYVDDEMYSKWMQTELEAGDILMTSEAPLGEIYYLADKEKYCLSQRLYALRANLLLCEPLYLYYELSSSRTQAVIQSRASGSTVLGIRQSELRKIPIITPPITLQQQFANIARPLLIQKNLRNKEIFNLSRIFKVIHPKLISGEIRVPIEQD